MGAVVRALDQRSGDQVAVKRLIDLSQIARFEIEARLLAQTEAGGTIGVGTPRFMAPEIFAGGAVSERSDVFSLATTSTTLIAGKLPSYGDRTSLREQFPDVTPDVEVALKRGMEFMPER